MADVISIEKALPEAQVVEGLVYVCKCGGESWQVIKYHKTLEYKCVGCGYQDKFVLGLRPE